MKEGTKREKQLAVIHHLCHYPPSLFLIFPLSLFTLFLLLHLLFLFTFHLFSLINLFHSPCFLSSPIFWVLLYFIPIIFFSSICFPSPLHYLLFFLSSPFLILIPIFLNFPSFHFPSPPLPFLYNMLPSLTHSFSPFFISLTSFPLASPSPFLTSIPPLFLPLPPHYSVLSVFIHLHYLASCLSKDFYLSPCLTPSLSLSISIYLLLSLPSSLPP